MIESGRDSNALEPVLISTGKLPYLKYHLYKRRSLVNGYEKDYTLSDQTPIEIFSKLKIGSILIPGDSWFVDTLANHYYRFHSPEILFTFDEDTWVEGYYATNAEETEIYWFEIFDSEMHLPVGGTLKLLPRVDISNVKFKPKEVDPYQWFDIKLCKEKHDPLQAVSS